MQAGGGRTSTAAAAASTSVKGNQLKAFQKKLKDGVKSMVENLSEIVKSSQMEEESRVLDLTHAAQNEYEMSVRAANMLRAGESLLRLVADLKEYLVLNDFPSLNESIAKRRAEIEKIEDETTGKVAALRDDMIAQLSRLEQTYYSHLDVEKEKN
ncbi:mediator of RNA polymerase II transcription subunit 22-like [Oscarella lobularis]|uniref:mediator of RNA polymerase II transcription subunit 22-like n=1 Tax=Oscarella lobularis TaxID=121494 RepID=UPI003313D1F7